MSGNKTLSSGHVEDDKHQYAVIGNSSNHWLHSPTTGFDLTRSEAEKPDPTFRKIRLKATPNPVTICSGKSALIIIDMQNFFLSEALGRRKGAGHAACHNLMEYAIPAARKAGIRVVWLNWGLNDEEVGNMPPAVKRAFGFHDMNGQAVDRNGQRSESAFGGLGSEMGSVTLPSGESVDAGRLLMRDTWNAALYPPLSECYERGRELALNPDVWIHKNRMSGLWGATTACEKYLEQEGINSLIFAGVNTDQCVSGTLTDAFSKGFDCILLSDGCGTTSPAFTQEGIEWNAARTWGFVVSCEDLAKGVDETIAK